MLEWIRGQRTPKQRAINIVFLLVLIILLTIAIAKVNMRIDQLTAEQAQQAAELMQEQMDDSTER